MAEAVNTTTLTDFQDYCREYKEEMLALPVIGADWIVKKGYQLVLGRDEVILSSLLIQDVVQPWRTTWNPKEVGEILPRTLKIRKAEIPLVETPEKYRGSYIGLQMQNKVDSTKHPFERFFVEKVMMTAKDNMYLALMNGVHNAAGTSYIDVADGLLKIIADEITADNISATPNPATNKLPWANLIATGVIDATNALDKIKDFYRALPAQAKSQMLVMYVSHNIADFYYEAYIAEHNGNKPVVDSEGNMYLEGTGGMCKIQREHNMGASQRIICTMPQNIFIGADDENSLSERMLTIRQGENPKALQFFAEFGFGVQFGLLASVFVNDQA